MMKLNRAGFGGIELIMVVLTVSVVAGSMYWVLTQHGDGEVQEPETAQTEEESEESNVDLDAVRVRDNRRRENLKLVKSELEAYFGQNGFYPSSDDFGNEVWRVGNLYQSPESEAAYTDHPIMYSVRPTGCSNSGLNCSTYDISMDLEFDGLGAQDADGENADATELSGN